MIATITWSKATVPIQISGSLKYEHTWNKWDVVIQSESITVTVTLALLFKLDTKIVESYLICWDNKNLAQPCCQNDFCLLFVFT